MAFRIYLMLSFEYIQKNDLYDYKRLKIEISKTILYINGTIFKFHG